jgi:hypothetical protein
MRVFKELEEVETMQDNVKDMSDIILDSYKKHPKECKKLLKELNSINSELSDLEKSFKLLLSLD